MLAKRASKFSTCDSAEKLVVDLSVVPSSVRSGLLVGVMSGHNDGY